MIKCAVFDVGGTLMEYAGMPYVWHGYYETALNELNKNLGLGLSEEKLSRSLEILKSYNPGINYREIDYPPETIFGDATKDWNVNIPLEDIISAFFATFHLKSVIYPETVATLEKIRSAGIAVGTYTNVVSGMPDEMHKSYFRELLPLFDIYVSSTSCGFRKPNPRGLEIIAESLKISPKEMIFIGDEQKDPETARRFDCSSVLINRSGDSRDFGQDYEIDELGGLLPILGIE